MKRSRAENALVWAYATGFWATLAIGMYVAWTAPTQSDAIEAAVMAVFIAFVWPPALLALLLAKAFG